MYKMLGLWVWQFGYYYQLLITQWNKQPHKHKHCCSSIQRRNLHMLTLLSHAILLSSISHRNILTSAFLTYTVQCNINEMATQTIRQPAALSKI